MRRAARAVTLINERDNKLEIADSAVSSAARAVTLINERDAVLSLEQIKRSAKF